MVKKKTPRAAGRYYRADFFSRTGMPLCVLPVDSHRPIPLHGHDFTELVLVRAGQGTHITGRGRHPLCAGDVFVIHGPELHAYEEVRGFSITNVFFDLEELNLPLQDMREMPGYQALFSLEPALRKRHGLRSPLHLDPADLAAADDLARRILSESTAKTRGYRALCLSLFCQMIVFLSRCYQQGRGTDAASLLRLGAALSLMESRFQERITLGDLAAAAGMSQSSFQRAFRRALDRSPVDYLIRFRIRKSTELLKDPSLSVTQAAFRSGFEDSNYFSRMFKRVTGASPRQYRARLGRFY